MSSTTVSRVKKQNMPKAPPKLSVTKRVVGNPKKPSLKTSRGKSKERKETAFEQKVEKAVKKSLEHPSQAIESLIHKVTTKLDIKANSGNVVAVPLSNTAIANFIGAWVDNVTRQTPVCVSAIGLSSRVYPVELYLFAYVALLLHIRRVGQLNGDTLGELPQFLKDLSIPVPLAKFFEYCGKFTRYDQNLLTSYVMPSGFMNALVNQGFIDPAATYPFPVLNIGLVYDLMTISGMKELAANRDWVPVSVATWCQTRLQAIANTLRSLDMAVVPLGDIPENAPSIDAYACRGRDRLTGNPIPNRVFALSPIHDEDVAAIFSQGRSLITPFTWMSKIIATPYFDLNFAFTVLSVEAYLACGFMFFMMSQNEFKPGPVKDVYRLHNGPKIKTFAWAMKLVDEQAVKTLIAQCYKQLQAKIPNFLDTQAALTSWRILYSLETLFLIHLLHRVDMANPLTGLALPLSGTLSWASTAFHTDGITDNVPLPAAMTEFISSLGVVVSEGAMIVPRFLNAARSPETMWGSPSFAGNLIMQSWRGLNYPNGVQNVFPFPFLGNTTSVPNFKAGDFIWDVNFNANYTAVNVPLYPYPIQVPAATVSSFVAVWKAALGNQYYQNISMAMTCAKPISTRKFGRPSQMLAILEVPSGGDQIVVLSQGENSLVGESPPQTSDKLGTVVITGPLFFRYSLTTTIGSSIVFDKHELTESLVLGADRIFDIGLSTPTAPYLCRIVGSDSLALTSSMIDATTQPSQDNGDMIPNPVKLPSGQLVPTKIVEKRNNQPSAWDVALHRAGAEVLEGGAGIAAGLACDVIPIIGELVSPLCAAGASSLVSTFMSRSSTYASGLANRDADVDHRARIEAVKSGVYQVGKAVGAASDSIAHASKALSNVAAAHTYGIMKGSMARLAK